MSPAIFFKATRGRKEKKIPIDKTTILLDPGGPVTPVIYRGIATLGAKEFILVRVKESTACFQEEAQANSGPIQA